MNEAEEMTWRALAEGLPDGRNFVPTGNTVSGANAPSGLSARRAVEVPGQEPVESAVRVAGSDCFDSRPGPGVWLDAVQFRGLDERSDSCPCSGAFIVTGEHGEEERCDGVKELNIGRNPVSYRA